MVIRSITFSSNWENFQIEKKDELVKEFFKSANQEFLINKYDIRTNRLNLSPFSVESKYEAQDIHNTINWLSRFCSNNNIRWLCVPFETFQKDMRDVNNIALEVIKRSENVFVNYILAKENKINKSGIYFASKLVKSLSKLSNNGFENFKFGTLFNCPPNAPYFPFTYNSGQDGFSIALELIPVWIKIINQNRNKNLEYYRHCITQELIPKLKEIDDLCVHIAKITDTKYYGIDCSLAPFPDNENGSVVGLYEKLGSDGFGSPGTVFLTSYLTNVIKNIINESKIKSIGFNGVMFSLLEDYLLSKNNNKREFSIDSLISYSTVCGCGLDMVPLPGDIFEEEIASIMLDVAGISSVLGKPLGVRLLPILTKNEGEFTDFNHDFVYNTRILNATNKSCIKNMFELNDPFHYY